jgi:hypothetical protein
VSGKALPAGRSNAQGAKLADVSEAAFGEVGKGAEADEDFEVGGLELGEEDCVSLHACERK